METQQYIEIVIEWELLTDCNKKCSYCYFKPINDKKYDLYTRLYPLIIKKLKKLKNRTKIVLLGGEPTLHPNFQEIIHELNNISNIVEIELITNGSTLQHYYNYLKQYKKVRVNISYHFEYHSTKFLKNIVDLQLDKKIVLMIHPNIKFYNNTQEVIQLLNEYNIEYETVEIIMYKDYHLKMKDFFIFEDVYDNDIPLKCTLTYFTINSYGILFSRCDNSIKKPFVLFNDADIKTIICKNQKCPSGNCSICIKEKINA